MKTAKEQHDELVASQQQLDALSLLILGVFGSRECVGRPPLGGELHALVSAIWDAGYRKSGRKAAGR